MRTDLGSRRR